MTERQIIFLERAGGTFSPHKIVAHSQLTSVRFVEFEPYAVDPPLQPDDYQAVYDVCGSTINELAIIESDVRNWELGNEDLYPIGELRFITNNQRVIFYHLTAEIRGSATGDNEGNIDDSLAVVYGTEPDELDIPQWGGTVFNLFTNYSKDLKANTHYYDSKGVLDSTDDFDILDI